MGSSTGRAGSSRAKGRTRGAANPVGKGHDAPRYEQGRRASAKASPAKKKRSRA